MPETITITKISNIEVKEKGILEWDVWEKGQSLFPWVYTSEETCYFIEGRVKVTTMDKKVYNMGKGDLVVFPYGLECTWEIIEPVTKRYIYS